MKIAAIGQEFRKLAKVAAGVCVVGATLLAALPNSGFADTKTVRCKSGPGGKKICETKDTGKIRGVRLTKKLSPARCSLNRSWTYGDDSVTVGRGCSGQFEVYHGTLTNKEQRLVDRLPKPKKPTLSKSKPHKTKRHPRPKKYSKRPYRRHPSSYPRSSIFDHLGRIDLLEPQYGPSYTAPYVAPYTPTPPVYSSPKYIPPVKQYQRPDAAALCGAYVDRHVQTYGHFGARIDQVHDIKYYVGRIAVFGRFSWFSRYGRHPANFLCRVHGDQVVEFRAY